MPFTERQERFFHAKGIKHSHDYPVIKMDKKILKRIRTDLQWFKSHGYHGVYEFHEATLRKVANTIHTSRQAYYKKDRPRRMKIKVRKTIYEM